MVTHIEKPNKDIENAQNYNEKKTEGPEMILDDQQKEEFEESDSIGHVLVTRNVPEGSTLEGEFERLKTMNMRKAKTRKVDNPTFHMSVNPGEQDKPLSESEIVSFIDELMAGLGYKDQPYRIYRHHDIDREHYHVISTRIGQDYKKINDAFENRRCLKITEELASKYGYIVGNEETEKKKEEKNRAEGEKDKVDDSLLVKEEKTSEKPAKKPYVKPFDKDSDVPKSEQYRMIHADAMTWNFTTPEQYELLMQWRYLVDVQYYNDGIHFHGISIESQNGKKIKVKTPSITERELGIDASYDVARICTEAKSDNPKTGMRFKKAQRERLENVLKELAGEKLSWQEFKKAALKKGIYVNLSYPEGSKEPFGVTYIDRATKCIWKGSDTHVKLDWLKEQAEEHGWNINLSKPKEERKISQLVNRPEQGMKAMSSPKRMKAILDNGPVGTKERRSNVDASKNHDDLLKDGERPEIKL